MGLKNACAISISWQEGSGNENDGAGYFAGPEETFYENLQSKVLKQEFSLIMFKDIKKRAIIF
jgi:hypothetical protein